MLDELKGFGVTLKYFFGGRNTIQYPRERRYLQDRFRGVPCFPPDPATGREKCVGCGLCARACPSFCITVGASDQATSPENVTQSRENFYRAFNQPDGQVIDYYYYLDASRCVYCGFCVDACPVEALAMSHRYELATDNRERLMLDKDVMLAIGKEYVAEMERRAKKVQKGDKKKSGGREAA